MAEAEAPNPDKGDQEKTTPEPQRPLVVLRGGLAVIKKAVEQKETRTLFGRLLRQTAGVRRRLTAADLTAFLNGALPQGSPVVQQLVDAVQQVGCGSWGAFGGMHSAVAGHRRSS